MAQIPDSIRKARASWFTRPSPRPAHIVSPGPGQESVWDYPRPPRLEPVTKRIRVEFDGRVVADSRRALRVLETSHPPSFYLPPADVDMDRMARVSGSSLCEWKGACAYWTVLGEHRRAERAAWSYPDPFEDFAALQDHLSFYCAAMDTCWVGDQRARPQPGGFYGGWITDDLTGPFKGVPGSVGW